MLAGGGQIRRSTIIFLISAAATPKARARKVRSRYQTRRSTIIFLISAIALAGFRPFGQAWVQFMIVWQR